LASRMRCAAPSWCGIPAIVGLRGTAIRRNAARRSSRGWTLRPGRIEGGSMSGAIPIRAVAQNAAEAAAYQHARGDDWPEPRPIPRALKPVARFRFDFLPESLQPWARDISERLQCPDDFVGVGIMVALGSVIGRRIGIRPQELTDWTEFPNLWGCIVGR